MGGIIRKEFSTYLDVVRFTAAMAVFASHLIFPRFTTSPAYVGAMGGVAVAWFFVLSGYVIAYVAHEKETTLKQYAASRLARVYSVAIPAILLTMMIDLYLTHHGANETELSSYEYRKLWKYLPVFLVFGSNVGGFQAQVFGNGPFWSLSYEVWYYIAFATLFYLRGVRRLIFGAAALAILGFPALLYFPIWVLGATIYFCRQRISIAPNTAAIGALGAGLAFFGLLFINAYDYADSVINGALHGWPRLHLHNSSRFPSFYAAGLLAGANIFFGQYCRLNFLSNQQVKNVIVYLASFTFAIYLSHMPLINLWSLVIRPNPRSPLDFITVASLILFSCWCFGFVSEKQKERWRGLFRRILNMPDTSLSKFKMQSESSETTIP
jgi:peptidoglycan/LPS O-acetylase OafA/YrhL